MAKSHCTRARGESVPCTCDGCGKAFFRPARSVRRSRTFCDQRCYWQRGYPLVRRFWEKVSRREGCWPWEGTRNLHGYGIITEHRRVILAHRVSWELHFGPVPAGRFVLHRCDNPPCVNPDHLFLGTQRDNNADKMRKQRQARGERFPLARLTDEKVRFARERFAAGAATLIEIARELGVSASTVSLAVHGKTWRHVL